MLKLAIKIFPELSKILILNGEPNIGHQVEIIMKVVNGIQMIAEYFTALKKVPQISSGIIPASIT